MNNRPVPGAAVVAIGSTNIGNRTDLVVQFQKLFEHAPKPPWSHKAYLNVELALSCRLFGGATTNTFWREHERYIPERDLTYTVRLPPATEAVQIIKAQAVLGSYQDINWPFNKRSLRRSFTCRLPSAPFSVSQPVAVSSSFRDCLGFQSRFGALQASQNITALLINPVDAVNYLHFCQALALKSKLKC